MTWMNFIRPPMKKTAPVIALVAVLLATSALAGVFVFYPMTMNFNVIEPPIVFIPGSNAGQTDLTGGAISVTIAPNGTEATLSLNPTLQKTMYVDVLEINNTGTITPYVYIRVNTPVSFPTGSQAYLDINGTTVDLTTSNTVSLGQLAPGQKFIVNVVTILPDSTNTMSTSAVIELIYSPESSPPP